MFIVIVLFDSKTEHRKELIDVLLEYGRDVQQNEPDTVRFEIIHDLQNPNRFYLYEVYRDRAGFDAHAQRPEFGPRWEKLQGWLAAPPTHLCSGTSLFPPNDATYWQPAAP